MYSVDEQYRYIKVLFYLFHLIKVLRFGEFGVLALPSNISFTSLVCGHTKHFAWRIQENNKEKRSVYTWDDISVMPGRTQGHQISWLART